MTPLCQHWNVRVEKEFSVLQGASGLTRRLLRCYCSAQGAENSAEEHYVVAVMYNELTGLCFN